MRKYLFVFCTIGALVSCSSAPKKQDNKSSQVVEKYEKKMRDIASAGARGTPSVSTRQNPYLQNVDLTIVGPDGDVILFYKDGNNIVIQECESYTVISQRSDCRPKGRARNTPVSEFKSRLKAALRVENFDTLSAANVQKLKDYHEGVQQAPTAQDLVRQRDEAQQSVDQLKAFITAYGADNASPGLLNELEAKLAALNQKVAEGQGFSNTVVEINRLIDNLVDQVIGGAQMNTRSYSADRTGIEYSVLRTYVRPYLAQAAFVPLHAGSFSMGSPSGESNRSSDERQHNVTLSKDFEIGATEVTQLQWVVVRGSNPSYFKEESYCPDSYMEINGVGLCSDLPVERVSWNEIREFITEYNNRANDGYTYSLPTEAQWEYAARASTQTAYSFGDNPSQLGTYAWYSENSNNQTHYVASKAANPWGLYDMHGNVWEWVQDRYDLFSSSATTDPVGPTSGSNRVLRGGGWYGLAQYLRSAFRHFGAPDYSIGNVGFRLVRAK